MVAMWAIVCAGFTYDTVQEQKEALYRKHRLPSGNGESETFRSFSSPIKHKDLKNAALQAYRKELRELYWVFTPFLWFSLTLSGCIVAAGFILPITFRITRST